jgi:hypothetical protein
VYKVRQTTQREEEVGKSKQKEGRGDKSASANVPAILLKRKLSKPEE